jgi:DNA-binding NtrC family response regulator
VEVVHGPDAGLQARLERPLFRIGSDESNDLVLSDRTVSKHHLEVAVVPDGYRLTDLGSSNGTLIGSARIGELTVVEPVRVRLGKSELAITPTGEEAEVPASSRSRFGGAVGRSVVMRELFEQLEAVAPTDASLLIEGETGVGKEQIAESVHRQSARASGPFVVVDCGALVGELLEAELFGWVRGAFSGAAEAHRGLLESASGGTLFLDEVGELPLAMQVKLLGALERRKVRPLGATGSRTIDVRVIAATHRNLGREMNQGRFRPDLYYRLAVVRVRVPPLRDRLDDIPLLVTTFLEQLRGRYGQGVPRELSTLVLNRMAAHNWPGNVRELRNSVERAVLRVRDDEEPAPVPPPLDAFFTRRADALEAFERRYFTELIERARRNMSQAARLSQLDRRYLLRILKRLDLYRPQATEPES